MCRSLQVALLVSLATLLALSGELMSHPQAAQPWQVTGTQVTGSASFESSHPSGVGSVIGTIQVGSFPWGIAVDSVNGYVYVANGASDNVSVINGADDSVVGSIPLPGCGQPVDVAADTANQGVYVTCTSTSGPGSVAVINGSTDTLRVR